MFLFKVLSCIYLLSFLISVSCLTKNHYFLNEQQNEQNTDDEWIVSKEESDHRKEQESNENNDFKFDDQSTFKVSFFVVEKF